MLPRALVGAFVLTLVFVAACSAGDKPPSTPTPESTAAATPTPIPCPVAQEICDFAATTQTALQARDYPTLAASTPGLEPGLRQQAEFAIPTGTPRLVSIGCPFGAVDDSCEEFFGLVFTTLAPSDDWRTDRGILLLRYEVGRARPVLRAVTGGIIDTETRRVALAGGIAQGPCNLLGVAPGQSEQTCSRSFFYAHTTDGVPYIPQVRQPDAPFVLKDPIAPQPNTAMFVAVGCWSCEGYDQSLQRLVTNAAGVTTVTRVPEPPLAPGEKRTSIDISADGSLLVAVVCAGTNCGPLGTPTADLKSRVLTSRDVGYTWTEAFSWAGYAGIIGINSKGSVLLDLTTAADDPAGPPRWQWLDGTPVSRPANVAHETWPQFRPDASLAWSWYEGDEVYAQDGSVIFSAKGKFTAQDHLGSFRFLPDGRVLVGWRHDTGAAPGPPSISMFSMFNPAGVELWRREMTVTNSLNINAFVAPRKALANYEPRPANTSSLPAGRLPALIDLDAGIIQPFGAPFLVAPFLGRNTFEAYLAGPFVTVVANGDCLNVRESPSASGKILTCAKDFSLMYDLGQTSVADGTTWLKVRTLAGEEGWASQNYLAR